MRFGRSPSVLGKSIALNGVSFAIVGVAPAQFTGLQMSSAAQVFVPLTMQPVLAPRAQLMGSGDASLLNNTQSWWIQILARLRQDVPEARAKAALNLVLRETAMDTLPKAKGMDQFHLQLEPGDRGLDDLRERFAKPSYDCWRWPAWLPACVNLANLLLARGESRQREMSTRLALGAGRARFYARRSPRACCFRVSGVWPEWPRIFGTRRYPQSAGPFWERIGHHGLLRLAGPGLRRGHLDCNRPGVWYFSCVAGHAHQRQRFVEGFRQHHRRAYTGWVRAGNHSDRTVHDSPRRRGAVCAHAG